MGKYLKTYKLYPAGTIIACRNYSLWQRFKYWLKRKKMPLNYLYILPMTAGITISKVDLLLKDFLLFIPKKTLNKREFNKLQTLVSNCKTTDDYFAVINIIRPNTITEGDGIDSLQNNKYYITKWLDEEPFQNVESNQREIAEYIYAASE